MVLRSERPRFAHLEDLQIRHQEGHCVDAFDGKQLVGVEDLESDGRWPAFREAAVARRVRAVLASPPPYNQDAVGVVAVLSEQRRAWSPEGELALLAFTDLAALLIASMMQGQEQSELAGQLQAALKSRQVIERAKGVLVGRDGITPREAYVQLRAQARNERRKLAGISRELPPDSSRLPITAKGVIMIILGLILLIAGFLLRLAIVWTIGIVVLAAGFVLALLGAVGRGIGGRQHYW